MRKKKAPGSVFVSNNFRDRVQSWDMPDSGCVMPPKFKLEFRCFQTSSDDKRLFVVYEMVGE